jgi:hypothetical protein
MFLHLASQSKLPRLHKPVLAPFHLHKAMLDKMDAAGAAAKEGQTRASSLKMNALTDEALMRARWPCRAARREDRPDRARGLHPARPGAGLHRQHPRALGHRALPGAFAGVLLPHR